MMKHYEIEDARIVLLLSNFWLLMENYLKVFLEI
jgi:hypothetical protein